MFEPKFQITPALTKILMDIEASRQAVTDLPVALHALTALRESARLTATHYSTQIEGNRLTQEQVEQVIQGGTFPNRQRDELEVKNYYLALDFVETLIRLRTSGITERDIQTVHGLVMEGKEQPSTYRDGQNVIKDSGTGAIVYMPPEAKDVPVLMNSLVKWIHHQKEELPVPIVAAIAHHQFATIHPYYDGNGRTARLLTNIVLHKSGYGLKGIYSLEEYYAGDLQAYYAALDVGDSHNYYTGRAEGDVTPWILYFCSGMANAFANARLQLAAASTHLQQDHSALLRELDQRQKRVMSLFKKSKFITTREIATLLKIHPRTALNLCKKWLAGEFIIQHGAANKNRKYELAERWLELI